MTHRLHDPARPTVPDALPLARAVYARHSSGCCLHVLLDDDNLEDRTADFCVVWALEAGHEDCYLLARMVRGMTVSQRGRLARRLHAPPPPLEVGDLVEVNGEAIGWTPGIIDGFHPLIDGEPYQRANVRAESVGLFFRGCHPGRVRRVAR